MSADHDMREVVRQICKHASFRFSSPPGHAVRASRSALQRALYRVCPFPECDECAGIVWPWHTASSMAPQRHSVCQAAMAHRTLTELASIGASTAEIDADLQWFRNRTGRL